MTQRTVLQGLREEVKRLFARQSSAETTTTTTSTCEGLTAMAPEREGGREIVHMTRPTLALHLFPLKMLTSLEMIDSPRLAREERRVEPDSPRGRSPLSPCHGFTTVSLYQQKKPPPRTISCLQQAAAISAGPDWTWAGQIGKP
ncbi:hypothetical protein JOB18_047578 [Solea senegalensis]|uniref:Uncharacterized protein n=1 Tax=Solea senegalensis TaxID=28829 RepID=A0AAV6S413_SOLSE|nr:hypothetical protein JOB18_047578 [Solea senegalensis]